jgi:crotonobetainyl-CoA:carnitine CoA-transferase CaiB-like acyl-CoA transferase
MILSDLGAEVVKVEEPGIGDYMRMTPPTYEGTSLVDDMVNRNKRSVGINLKCEEGKEILRKIIAKSDVFVEGFRPGVIDRLGFSFDKVRKINSRIVYCSISAFGRGSRLSNIPGHDLNFEAMSGILAYGSSPEIPYVQYADLCAGVYAAIGVIASLHSRHYGATRVDVPIVQSLMSWMIIPYSAYLATNVEPRPGHSLLFGS